MPLSQKGKTFYFIFFFFLHFLNLDSILNIFKKRRLFPVSEDPSTSNMVNAPKHCSKLDDSTFTIFIDISKNYSDLKSLPQLYAES